MGRNVAPFYAGWELANEALIEAIRDLTSDQLALLIRPEWPIWASVSHVAGGRIYWLCHIFKEPGSEATPFTDPAVGWEDDLGHPRNADELVGALESTWRVVAHTLDAWTPGSLTHTAQRKAGDKVQIHTRQSVLWRLITHDAFHSGEISLTLGRHGLGGRGPNGPVDLWSALSHPLQ